MDVHKKFIDVLIRERQGVLYNFISDAKDGLGLTSTSNNFFQQLDQILYTINYLEKLDLINIQKNSDGLFIGNFFDGYKSEETEGEISAFLYLQEKMEERKSWWIEINPGLFRYKSNGYKTDEEKQEYKHLWLTVGSVILTAILTGLFTKLFDIYL
ncbi:MAG: hypothetical protein COV70_00230 [Parcubacteria group bacterium CG11_big_fil_rev_8_21_14_0_20_39_22]|nr:MAG: hypothetical protein COV70_00230 [Parcubacteria group bacterium CG11_big_fil_rev_8_21_14_0_20_39_22]